MEQQFRQEEWFSHPLPPRSTVHRKDNKKKKVPLSTKKWNSLQIIVFLFIFLIIGTAYGVYQYGKTKEVMNQRTPINPSILQGSQETGDPNHQSKNINQSRLSQEYSENDSKTKNIQPLNQDLEKSYTNEKPIRPMILHLVQSGETMFRISLKYYKTGRYAEKLAKYNQIKDFSKLETGSTLKIPDIKELTQFSKNTP
ncbi:LysM peptidoglycan-binding domain-containing protein [Tepidibacillus sp. LV47]|uniref:LysM peptidoglycan-binding domain-containing protein n=1 Tax=Tepidibacillus sp. LV47 TaxID=3398228 RepID=UPI003AAD2C63